MPYKDKDKHRKCCSKYQKTHRKEINQHQREYTHTPEGRKVRRENERRYRLRHKEKVSQRMKKYQLRVWYNITPENYTELLLKQNGVCAICGKPETTIAYGKVQVLSVDHDHKTGKVRGLLCVGCNQGLGRLGEDNLERAISYLKGK